MKNIFLGLLLLLIWALTEKFFYLIPLKYDPRDIIFVIGIIYIFFSPKQFIRFIKNNRILVSYLLGMFLINFISSGINYHYSLLNQFKGGRFLLSYVVIFYFSWVFVKEKLKTGKKIKIPYIFPILLIIINFYTFFSGNLNLFTGQLKVSERFGEIRFLIGGTSIIYLYLFYLGNNKLSIMRLAIVFLLFLTVLVVGKTRGVTIPMFLTFVVFILITFKNIKSRRYLVTIIFGTFFLILLFWGNNPVKTSFTNIIHSTQNDISESSYKVNNFSLRLISLSYYWNIFSSHLYNVLFGVGYESVESVSKLSKKLYLSDVGFFKVIYYQGIFGVFYLFYIMRMLYIRALDNNYTKLLFLLFILFQLFSFTTLNFFYHPTSVMYFFVLYSVIMMSAKDKKLIANSRKFV